LKETTSRKIGIREETALVFSKHNEKMIPINHYSGLLEIEGDIVTGSLKNLANVSIRFQSSSVQ
jgi:hypothetical protein